METTHDYKGHFNNAAKSSLESAGNKILDTDAGFFNGALKKIKASSADAYEDSISMVKRKPVASLATALGIGVVVGWAITRKR